jgi:hypothetical protein
VAVVVLVGVLVGVEVFVTVGVVVGVDVGVAVGVAVAVFVRVGVAVLVQVGVAVGVAVGVNVGVGVWQMTKIELVVELLTVKPPNPPMPAGIASLSTPIARARSCMKVLLPEHGAFSTSSKEQEVKSAPAPGTPSFGARLDAQPVPGVTGPPGTGNWFVTTSMPTPWSGSWFSTLTVQVTVEPSMATDGHDFETARPVVCDWAWTELLTPAATAMQNTAEYTATRALVRENMQVCFTIHPPQGPPPWLSRCPRRTERTYRCAQCRTQPGPMRTLRLPCSCPYPLSFDSND